MYQSIVLAYDASSAGNRALDAAAAMARAFDASLTVVHARLHGRIPSELVELAQAEGLTGSDGPAASGPGAPSADMDDPLHRDPSRRIGMALGEMILARAQSRLREAGVGRVRAELASGDAADEIVATANSEHADLVVLGSRGLGELRGLMLGSVSHKVLQSVDCACLIVK